MKNQFIPYALCLILKNLNFNEKCFDVHSDVKSIGKFDSSPRDRTPKILWQQAFDWFRDNHGLDSNIISWKKGGKIVYHFSVKKLGEQGAYRSIECETEDRYIAQIKCLEKLIEKISNGKK